MTSEDAVHGTSFDPILTLASSLDAAPGSHAVLLGAGISISAGVPSAWGVQKLLIRRIAALEHEEIPGEPHDWYLDKFGQEATYESLLEGLGRTPDERQGVLREIFEPDTVDPEATRPAPSTAHLALAELAAAGALRVFITLNFDHLMEQALRAKNIEPNIVRSPAELASLPPLHTLRAVVVHLHGDYLTPWAMRNTVEELSSYEQRVQEFLDKVLTDHALLVVGWSAEYDPALREAVHKSLLQRFTSYWNTLNDLGPHANALATACRIVHIPGSADDEIGRLADAFAALRSRRARHPLTLHDAVGAVKRELSGRTLAVGVHDRLRAELARLRDHEALNLPDYNNPSQPIDELRGQLGEAASTTAGLIAATAYWGDERTDRWWLSELPRFSTPARGGSMTDYLALPQYAGTILFQAAGIAAVAAERYELVLDLLTRDAEPQNQQIDPLSRRLAGLHGFGNSRTPSADAAELLRRTFAEHLVLGDRAYEGAVELFDILVMAQDIFDNARFDERAHAVVEARTSFDNRLSEYKQAEATNDVEAWERTGAAKARAHQQIGIAMGNLTQLASGDPHIRYARAFTDGEDDHGALRVRALIHELDREGHAHSLVQAGFAGGDPERLRLALEGVSGAVGLIGVQMRERHRGVTIPGYFWADTGTVPPY